MKNKDSEADTVFGYCFGEEEKKTILPENFPRSTKVVFFHELEID